MRVVLSLTLAIAIASGPSLAGAQSVSAGAVMQTYTVSETSSVPQESGTLLSVPVSASIPLLDGLYASVDAAYAQAWFRLAGGPRTTVGGVVDTRIAFVARRGGIEARVAGILPTGDVVASLNEAVVVGRLSSDLLPFTVTQWGTGGGWAADLGYRLGLGASSSAFASLGFVATRASEPAGFAYSPGHQLRARAHVQSEFDAASMWSLVVGLQKHFADEAGGAEFFRPGLRVEAVMSAGFPIGARESGIVYGGVFDQDAGELIRPSRSAPSALPGITEASRQVMAVGVELRARRDGVTWMPRADVRALRSATRLGQGLIVSTGVRAELLLRGERMGRRTLLEPSAAVRWGLIAPTDDASSMLMGVDVGFRVRWENVR